jgi:hypothetical protein
MYDEMDEMVVGDLCCNRTMIAHEVSSSRRSGKSNG